MPTIPSRKPIRIRVVLCAQISLVVMLATGARIALGQGQVTGLSNISSTPVVGVPHDYISGINETVDPANGALTIRLLAPTPHERGVNTPTYVYAYDSNSTWTISPQWQSGQTTLGTGTSGTFDTLSAVQGLLQVRGTANTTTESTTLQSGQNTYTTYQCQITTGALFGDANGGTHTLGLNATSNLPNSDGCSYFPATSSYVVGGDEQFKAFLDTSGQSPTTYVVDLHGDVVDVVAGNGTAVWPTGQSEPYEDSNGNYFNTTNRTWSATYSGHTYTRVIPGVSGSYVLTDDLSAPAPNFTLNLSSVGPTTNGNYCQISTVTFGQNASTYKTTTIQMPNGEDYVISYDTTYGLVNQIKYPTGATVTYKWSTIPLAEGVEWQDTHKSGQYGGQCEFQHDWFAITQRLVSLDGTNNVEEQDFQYETDWPAAGSTDQYGASDTYMWTGKKTTVITKDLVRGTSFQTVYTYSPALPTGGVDPTGMWGDHGYVPVEHTIQYFDTSGSLLKTTTKTWQTLSLESGECDTLPNGNTSGTFYEYAPYSGFGNQTPLNPDAKLTNLKTDVSEFDYGAVSSSCSKPSSTPLRETVTAYHSFAASPLFPYLAILDRPDSVKVYGLVNGSQVLESETDYGYDETAPTAPTSVPYGHDEQRYGSGSTAPRGNVTTVRKKCFVGTAACTDSVVTMTYDTTGQVLSVTDACGNTNCADMAGQGHTTYFAYDDNYTSDDGAPSQSTDAYVTKVTKPQTGSTAHITSYSYGFQDGKLRTMVDENGHSTSFCYMTGGCGGSTADPFYRLTGTTYPDSGGTTTTYNDAGPAPEIQTITMMEPPDNIESTKIYDAMGRLTRAEVNSDPGGVDLVDTTYDGLGNVASVSNPYRSGTSDNITYYAYDALGRQVTQLNPDGTSARHCYDGSSSSCPGNLSSRPTTSWTDTYDEAGTHWQRESDSLGRLIAVLEPSRTSGTPTVETDYSYDALNDLTSVVQNGDTSGTSQAGLPETPRTRTFSYDSLSHLIVSVNPETGETCYGQLNGSSCNGGYDANGNVSYKTDANGVVSSFNYDVLNRITAKGFSDGSRGQVYAYDGKDRFGNELPSPYSQNAVGRLTQSSDTISVSSHFAYDPMGRVIDQSDCQATACAYNNQMQATYDLAGNLTSFEYYDGRIVKQIWDGAGRLAAVWDATGGGASPVYLSGPSAGGNSCPPGSPASSCIAYTPSGAVSASAYGNGVSQSFTVNDRLQPYLSTASWTVNGSTTGLINRQVSYDSSSCGNQLADNGNIYSIVDSLQVGLTQTFCYDGVNRISQAGRSDGAFSHVYNYDSFGNMIITDNLNPNSAVKYETDPAATNRLLRSHDGGTTWGDYVYDATGALTQSSDGINPTVSYQHNAMGQLLSLNGGSETYLYDGADQRAYKQSASGSTTYAYFDGQPVAEMDQNKNWTDYIYANGQKIAKIDSQKPILVFKGTRTGSCAITVGVAAYQFAQQVGSFQSGDSLSWDEKVPLSDNGVYANGGAVVYGTSQPPVYVNDQYGTGEVANSWTDGKWHHRVFNFGSAMPGQSISGGGLTEFGDSSSQGDFEIDYANFTVTRANGSIITLPIQTLAGVSDTSDADNSCGSNNLSVAVQTMPVDAEEGTTYFLDDHLGSMQMELSNGGWPIWQGQYTPFGQEIVSGQVVGATLGNQQPNDGTSMHYEFTGKERDSESGLDYFGARYYGSSMGRWMSPDWSAVPVGVPYASLNDPQSLNLYAYVGNNPLSHRDSDGHHQECGAQTSSTDPKTGALTINANCHDVPDWWQFQGARRLLGRHKTAVKVTANVVIGVTAISGVFDAGASEAALPGEIALEEALLEGGELAAEEGVETGAVESAANAANKAEHIFGDKNLAEHNLESVLKASGGKTQAFEALQKATSAATEGTSGPFEKIVQVAGQNVTVRGTVINGAARIGTAFIPK